MIGCIFRNNRLVTFTLSWNSANVHYPNKFNLFFEKVILNTSSVSTDSEMSFSDYLEERISDLLPTATKSATKQFGCSGAVGQGAS